MSCGAKLNQLKVQTPAQPNPSQLLCFAFFPNKQPLKVVSLILQTEIQSCIFFFKSSFKPGACRVGEEEEGGLWGCLLPSP